MKGVGWWWWRKGRVGLCWGGGARARRGVSGRGARAASHAKAASAAAAMVRDGSRARTPASPATILTLQAKAAVPTRPDAAEVVPLLKHEHREPCLGERTRSLQPGHASADDYDAQRHLTIVPAKTGWGVDAYWRGARGARRPLVAGGPRMSRDGAGVPRARALSLCPRDG